jgi:hypothetical protein
MCTLYNETFQNRITKYDTTISANCVGAGCIKSYHSSNHFNGTVQVIGQSGGGSALARHMSAGTDVDLQQRYVSAHSYSTSTVHLISHIHSPHSRWPNCHFHCAHLAVTLWRPRAADPLFPQPPPFHQTYLRETECKICKCKWEKEFYLHPESAQWLLYAPPNLTMNYFPFVPECIYGFRMISRIKRGKFHFLNVIQRVSCERETDWL